MTRKLADITTTWPFVLGVVALVLNDGWLKAAWPGVVTGKLSDVAGITIVTLLALTAQPRSPLTVCALIVLAFGWFKSPWSQPMIDAANQWLPVTLGRTVDYTDLLAGLVMPLCTVVARRPQDFALPGAWLRRLLLAPLLTITTLGLMATSVVPTRHDYQIRQGSEGRGLDTQAVVTVVGEVARRHGMACTDGKPAATAGQCQGGGLQLRYRMASPGVIEFEVQAFGAPLFFGRSGREMADLLRNDLKATLGARFLGLEYLEKLNAATR